MQNKNRNFEGISKKITKRIHQDNERCINYFNYTQYYVKLNEFKEKNK